MNYDVIGDIHGHADKLTALLRKLGYRDHLGAWRHPDRTAIFVGDFIDRGPGQLETIDIVRRNARCRYRTGGDGQSRVQRHRLAYARSGTRRRAPAPPQPTRIAISTRRFWRKPKTTPHCTRNSLRWFLTLPLWLDLPELRVVHACWHPATWQRSNPSSSRGACSIRPWCRGQPPQNDGVSHVEGLTKGLEIELPAGHEFHDKDGHRRGNVRVRWWDTKADTYRKAAIIDSACQRSITRHPDSRMGVDRLRRSQANLLWSLLVQRSARAAGAQRRVRGLLRRQRWSIGRIPMGGRIEVERKRVRQHMNAEAGR